VNFFQNDHLNGLLMSQAKLLALLFLKGPKVAQILKFHIFGRHIEFFFSFNFDAVVFLLIY